MLTTVKEELANLGEEVATANQRFAWKQTILGILPADLPAPLICNERVQNGRSEAWLSFREQPKHHHPSAILAQLEDDGCIPQPVTLARYGNYRWLPMAGTSEDLPETYSRENFVAGENIVPLWIRLNQFTGNEATTFYGLRIKGTEYLFRVTVPAPANARLHAEVQTFPGEWSYVRGTSRIHIPPKWHSVRDADDSVIADVSVHTAAHIDADQSLSGEIYFVPLIEPFTMSPAKFLLQLEHTAR